MTKYDLVEAIKDRYCNGDVRDTIIEINDLICEIHNSPSKFISELANEIEDLAVSENLCPICSSELNSSTHREFRGECHGYPAYESVTITECSNLTCSYVCGR